MSRHAAIILPLFPRSTFIPPVEQIEPVYLHSLVGREAGVSVVNAAETIAAAIEKLETLRDAVAPAPWSAVRSEFDLAWQVHCSEWGGILSTGYVGNRDAQPTAELIVTLHRTIDAQLAILRDGLEAISPGDDTTEQITEAAERLARAVLTEVSR